MSDPEVIQAFLAARLDEDERVARAVKPLRCIPVMGGPMDEKFGICRLVPAVEDGMYEARVDPDAQAHIALHDPARTLREVEAKRRRLDRHLGERRRIAFETDPDDGSGWTSFGYFVCVACTPHREVRTYRGEQIIEWPCPDLIDDAQSWADNPDFPEELRQSD